MTRLATLTLLLAAGLCGCAGLNPIQGVPLREVSPDLLYGGRPRTPAKTIDLSLLQRTRPPAHVVDSGDVLGVYVEGLFGKPDDPPPVTAPIQLDANGLTTVTRPAAELGYPMTVSRAGTITLPYLGLVDVRGMTLGEVEAEVRRLASEGADSLFKEGREKVVVTLHKPRTVRVLVVRKDRETDPAYLSPPDYRRVEDGRGSAALVELPVYEADVMHAIVASGGMPRQDGENAVRVHRAAGGWSALGLDADASAGPGWSQPTPAAGPPAAPRPGHSEFLAPMPLSARAAGGGIVQASASVPTGHSIGGLPVTPLGPPRATMVVRSPGFAAASGPAFGAAPFDSLACDGAGCDGVSCDGVGCGPNCPGCFGRPIPPGGLLGLRGRMGGMPSATSMPAGVEVATVTPVALPAGLPAGCDISAHGPNVRRIPLTVLPGECPTFGPGDVTLGDGDIVFIESRDREFFYTAGLLGGGKYPMPRDEDLDLLDAIALADGQRRPVITRAVGGVSSLNQDVSVGASQVIVYRKTGDGGVVPIRVNLNRVKRDPTQSLLILPGDRIFLQYNRLEAIAAGFERFFIEGAVLGIASGITFGDG